MNSYLKFAIVAGGFLSMPSAYAAEQTVTLNVDGMTCASCPYIVRQSLASVTGVIAVDVSFELKTAIVTFDDAETDISLLTQATANMGFPSSLKR